MDSQTGVGAMGKAIKWLLWLAVFLGGVAHAGTVTYVYTDPQGTPLADADAAGTITATFDYAPYGSQALGSAPSGPGYTGHVNDPDTGLVYMQARYYDPSTGRFLSVDPVGPAPGNPFNFNRYAYADNSPIVHDDPTGAYSRLVSDDDRNRGASDTGIVGNDARDDGGDSLTNHSGNPVAASANSAAQPRNSASPRSAASPLKDNKGTVVTGANGQPALIPNGFDPNSVVKAGRRDNALGVVSPPLGAVATTADLAKFRRGGSWDLQRLGGTFDPRFIDSATILIGMYAASAGIARGQILGIENHVAKDGKYAAGTPLDPTYTHLPARNVTNTDIGMWLVFSGAIQ